jgi:hypothetical protein
MAWAGGVDNITNITDIIINFAMKVSGVTQEGLPKPFLTAEIIFLEIIFFIVYNNGSQEGALSLFVAGSQDPVFLFTAPFSLLWLHTHTF